MTITLGSVTLALPEGFEPMEASALEQAFGFSYEFWCGARDEKRHVMVAVIANEAGRVAGVLATAKDAVQGIERRMRGLDGYMLDRTFKGTVDGRKAAGFSYRYRALGIDHIGEVRTVKCGRTFHSIYLFGRSQDAASARQVFDEVLKGVRIA